MSGHRTIEHYLYAARADGLQTDKNVTIGVTPGKAPNLYVAGNLTVGGSISGGTAAAGSFVITDYGASTTAADNRAAIQSALDAAYNAGGGEVVIPKGIFLIDPNPGLQVKTNVTLRGTGIGSVIKLVNASTHNDNLIKCESWTNVALRNFQIDGNRTNQAGSPGSYTYTQYGIYFGTSSNSVVENVVVHSMTGVGIHFYNSTNLNAIDCDSFDNNYHGFEYEQAADCNLVGCRGNSNLLHGILISPGEVNGTGSKGNHVIGSTFDSNGNYGIATNAANGDISAYLNEGNIFTGNSITNNAFYGVNFYKQDKHVFSNNYVAKNGYFGIYAFQSSDNQIQNNEFVGNSNASAGGYDEILLEGASSGHGSARNIISGNKIIINKGRYGISEAAVGDGNNYIFGNSVPTAGTSGTINIVNSNTVTYLDQQTDQTIAGNKIFSTGFGVAANSNTPSTALGGLDAPFGTSSPARVFSKYGMQLVTSSGALDMYVKEGSTQNNVASFHNTYLDMHSYAIQNVSNPSNAQDAATKAYVDGKVTSAPASSTATGTPGTLAYDSSYLYVCIATNSWKRIALTSF